MAQIIARRDPSADATCTRMLGNWLVDHFCGAPLQLIIKEPKFPTYDTVVLECCAFGHILHGQVVVEELEEEIDRGYGL